MQPVTVRQVAFDRRPEQVPPSRRAWGKAGTGRGNLKRSSKARQRTGSDGVFSWGLPPAPQRPLGVRVRSLPAGINQTRATPKKGGQGMPQTLPQTPFPVCR